MTFDDTKISIIAEYGKEYAYWTRDQLKMAFEKKYKNKFVYAKAQSRGSEANEEFQFVEAYEMSGFNYDAFVRLLEQGKIYIDLKLDNFMVGLRMVKCMIMEPALGLKKITSLCCL